MWSPARTTAAATAEPVSLAEAKAQCTVATNADDAKITGLIAAARAHVETHCAIRLGTQTVEIRCDGFADLARLPVLPVQSITSIVYVDATGAAQTLPTEAYELRDADSLAAAIVPAYGTAWPAIRPGSRITLVAVVGYATVPPAMKTALLLLIGHLYALSNEDALIRSESVPGIGERQLNSPELLGRAVTATVERLLADYRVFLL